MAYFINDIDYKKNTLSKGIETIILAGELGCELSLAVSFQRFLGDRDGRGREGLLIRKL